MPPRKGCYRAGKEESSPPYPLEAREAYLALEAWGWAADGHQGSGPGPDGPLWMSSSSASCKSHSREWPLGHRSARGTGSRGASAAGCQPSRGSTPRPARAGRAGPAATPGHPETPQPWRVTQGVSTQGTCPRFLKARRPPARQLQSSQTAGCPPWHCLSSCFSKFYLPAWDLPLIPSLCSNKEGATNCKLFAAPPAPPSSFPSLVPAGSGHWFLLEVAHLTLWSGISDWLRHH